MDSSLDRPPGEMVSLGFDGVCVYRHSILDGPTLGPFWNRFRLDGLVFPPHVSRFLVRRKADRTRYRAGLGSHLEVFCSIGGGWLWDCSDYRGYTIFSDVAWCRERFCEDGFSFSGVFRAVFRRSDRTPPGV